MPIDKPTMRLSDDQVQDLLVAVGRAAAWRALSATRPPPPEHAEAAEKVQVEGKRALKVLLGAWLAESGDAATPAQAAPTDDSRWRPRGGRRADLDRKGVAR